MSKASLGLLSEAFGFLSPDFCQAHSQHMVLLGYSWVWQISAQHTPLLFGPLMHTTRLIQSADNVACDAVALPTWPLFDADGWWGSAVPDWGRPFTESPAAPCCPGLACPYSSSSSRTWPECCCRAASTSPTVDIFRRTAGCHCWLLLLAHSRCCEPKVVMLHVLNISFCMSKDAHASHQQLACLRLLLLDKHVPSGQLRYTA